MLNTKSIYDDRKRELELYFSIIYDLENGGGNIKTIDNSRFLKILKSNFLLMLYNLVEACTLNGLLEIYERIKNDNCTYDIIIDELKTIWLDNQIAQIYGPTTPKNAYQNRVKEIVDGITNHTTVILNKDNLNLGGNLDGNIIKKLCDKHRIRYNAQDNDDALGLVKRKRNSLAHGDESFTECARDMTFTDLTNIKNAVLNFMDGIISGMEAYYQEKQYKT